MLSIVSDYEEEVDYFDLNSKPRTFISCGVVNKLEPGVVQYMLYNSDVGTDWEWCDCSVDYFDAVVV